MMPPSRSAPVPATRGAGLLVGAGLLAYAAYVGVTWARYGRDRRRAPAPPLDRFMPTYEVAERHRVSVDAPVEATMAAVRALDLEQLPVARLLFRARAWLLGERAVSAEGPHGLAASTRAMGWGVLDDRPRALVMGAVCRPWEADPGFRAVDPDAFAAFHEPGLVRIVWAVGAEPDGTGGSVAWTETRVATTDAAARLRFRRYWALLSPGILLIRWAALRLVRTEAERTAQPPFL